MPGGSVGGGEGGQGAASHPAHGMTEFQLYNTLSRRVEPFAPASDDTVRMYTCGPTVYNPAHLGNFRTFLFEDLLRRALRLRGWQVEQVMNYYHSISQALAGLGLGVQRLDVDARLTARLTLDNGLLLVVDRDNFAFKLQRFARLYSKVLTRDGRSVERADLRYADGVAVEFADAAKPSPKGA